jgi:FkbM family methyltransferase
VRANRLGLELELDLRDSLQYLVYKHNSYEPNLSERIRLELEPGDVFVDVGAHIGFHALIVARELQRLGGGHVYAFEPTSDSADRLAATAERNAINNLTLVRAALGAATGQIEVRRVGAYGADEPSARSVFGSGHTVGVVPILRFDEWAREAGLSRLDVLKIDVEGGECAALVGMRETLARLRPRLLFVEVNPVALERANVTKEQLYAELARSGYKATQSILDDDAYQTVAFARSDCPR